MSGSPLLTQLAVVETSIYPPLVTLHECAELFRVVWYGGQYYRTDLHVGAKSGFDHFSGRPLVMRSIR